MYICSIKLVSGDFLKWNQIFISVTFYFLSLFTVVCCGYVRWLMRVRCSALLSLVHVSLFSASWVFTWDH